MPMDAFTYTIANESLEMAEKSMINARQWRENTTYEHGQICVFQNTFYRANYTHNSGGYFDYSAWIKINNDADKLKGLLVDITNKENGKALMFNKDKNKIEFGNPNANIILDTDIELTAFSDEKISSQKAIKTYIDNKLESVISGMTYKGTIDVRLGELPSNIKIGDFYKIVGSNTIENIQLNIGDMLIANKDQQMKTDMSCWDVIYNTESKDVLRDRDISNNADFSVETGKLTDRKTIKQYMQNINGTEELQTTKKTIKGAINEVFISGVNAKENVVTALTSKGANVTTQNTWSEIADFIYTIQGDTASDIIKLTKLNVEANKQDPYIKKIHLKKPISKNEVLSCVREFIRSGNEINLISDFNTDDGEHFEYDEEKIVFDGHLQQKRSIIKDMMLQRKLTTKDEYSIVVNKKEYNTIDKFDVENLEGYKLILTVTHRPQIAIANGDIDLEDVDKLKKIIFNCISSNGGKCLLAMSIDKGETYYVYNLATSSWEKVNIMDIKDFRNNGMTKTITDTLSEIELEMFRNKSDTLRFAYYIELVDGDSESKVDSLGIEVAMFGRQELANRNDYDVTLNSANNTATFNIYKNGTFSISVTN